MAARGGESYDALVKDLEEWSKSTENSDGRMSANVGVKPCKYWYWFIIYGLFGTTDIYWYGFVWKLMIIIPIKWL